MSEPVQQADTEDGPLGQKTFRILIVLIADMTTTNNSHLSDSLITDVLTGVGLNTLEQDKNTTLDIKHIEKENDFNNGCETKETESDCVPETIKEADASEIEADPVSKDVVSNGRKRILKMSENDNELNQPLNKKLRLSGIIPNEETDMSSKSKLNYSRPVIQFPTETPNVISTGSTMFPRKQNAGLPSTLQGINKNEVFMEKHFGLRIKNPLVTSLALSEKMSGKHAVHMDGIKTFIQRGEFENTDWVIAGVIVKKHATTSQAGKQYCSWTLSDLREKLLTVTVLLFSNAFKELWKSSIGTVVGILNPLVMESRSQHDGLATFSARSSDQIMLWGQSSDFGICKARKKNGEKCTMFVNKRLCSYCVYHAQKEYKKYCGRAELQKATGGNLRQMLSKKLGWNTPVNTKYTGLEERVPVRKNINLINKDRNLLTSLSKEFTLSKCNNKDKRSVTQTDNCPEIKPKTKLQEMLLLSKSTSPIISISTSGTHLLSHKNLELGKSNMVKSEKVTSNRKTTLMVKKSANEMCKGTVDKKKLRFEKLSLPIEVDCTDKKIQIVPKEKTANRNFDSKSLIDKIMTTKPTKNEYTIQKDFTLFIDKNSSTSKCDDTNKKINLAKKRAGNQNIEQPNEMTESTLGISNSNTECISEELNKVSNDVHVGTGSNRDKGGQTKVHKCGTERAVKNMKHKIHPVSDNKSNTSAECDFHKVENEPSENVNNQNRKCSADKLNDKKNVFTKDSCKELSKLVESEVCNGKHESLMNPKEPAPQSSHSYRSKAMMEAIRYVRKHGPIQKNRKSSEIKQLLSESQEHSLKDVDEDKNISVIPDKFKELMNIESTHTQLAESSAMEEYYSKMEQKEKIEDKLLNTYKVECKIVMCKICKYKSGSALEFCKQNSHPLVCVKGYRRFFKCSNCSKRTVVYGIFPHYNCVHCGTSSWIRVPVIEVKTTVADLNQLSLRGDEQKFINSHESNTNINLLIPEG